jgi:thiamine biosynthesis protein ThiI
MMEEILLIHYGELGLKGENRRFFVARLRHNIADALSFPVQQIQVSHQRLVIPLPHQGREVSVLFNRLSQVFGIAWFARAQAIEADDTLLRKVAVQLAKQIQPGQSFAVRAKRSDKKYPLSSIEVERRIGQILVDKTSAKVNLTKPDKTLFIEITPDKLYLFWDKHQGPGGLPVGTSGRVLSLFSGGIDSPVAAYLLAKRGATVDLLHFCTFPPEQIRKTKITTLYHQLQHVLGRTRLFVVPYVHFQLAVAGLPSDNARYEVLLFRRFMMQVGEQLAQTIGAQALVTGDNLSQVASQTLENLAVTDRNRSLPVFRPLLGFDKQEIVTLAGKIGTYETSIQPYKDCCSLLHKQPVTKGRWPVVEAAEARLNLHKLIDQSLGEVLVIDESKIEEK